MSRKEETVKALLYLLTVVLGAIGALAVLRSVERLVVGAGLMPVQLFMGVVFLGLAWLCLKKARGT